MSPLASLYPSLPLRCALLLACMALLLGCQNKGHGRFDPTLAESVDEQLWRASNRGRVPLSPEGFWAFPDTVREVVVDVGAYKLRRTERYLAERRDVALIAVEPMADAWKAWPDDPRVIGVPAAISLKRGMLSFNVNENDVTSSLLDTSTDSLLSTQTIEVREVPGVRLEDVLERIPPNLPIIFLKTDVQGMDLAALMSAGEQLRRVKEVHTEIINDPSYEKQGRGSMANEQEFHTYMASMGFSPYREIPAPERWIVDVFYRNDAWKD